MVEVRQKYFHLFWIPFFGLGKTWALRKADNKIYELPIDHENYLNAHDFKIKTPWYTFTGPILILAGLILGSVIMNISQILDQKNAEERFENKISVLNEQYEKIEPDDYVKLTPTKQWGSTYPLLQVLEVRPKEVVFKKVVPSLNSYDLSAIKLQSIFSSADMLDTVVISKEKLQKAVKREFEYAGVDLYGDGAEYIVENIMRYNGPVIIDRNTGSYNDKGVTIEFLNHGWPVTVVGIENKAGELKFETTFPIQLGSSDNIHDPAGVLSLTATNFKLNTPYEFEMVMVDSLNKEHRYNVKQVKGKYVEKILTKVK